MRCLVGGDADGCDGARVPHGRHVLLESVQCPVDLVEVGTLGAEL